MRQPRAALFDSAFLARLEHISFVTRRARKSHLRGEHTTLHRGASLEFADYRQYQPGDDFRYIDWNIYSRTHRLFVKLFQAEENLNIHILLDTSRSMGFGTPPKLEYAARVAAALAYVGVHNLDRVAITSFSDTLSRGLPAMDRRSDIVHLLRHLESLKADGRTDFNTSLSRYASSTPRAGLAFIISDLLDEGGYQTGLEALLRRGFDIVLIHLLDPAEINPELTGAYRLVDSETERSVDLDVDRSLLQAYRARSGRFFQQAQAFCFQNGIEYVRVTTAVSLQTLMLEYIRTGVYVR